MAETKAVVPLKYRSVSKGLRLISIGFPATGIFLALLFIFHWRPFGFVLSDVVYLYALLAAFLPLCFLWIPMNSKAPRDHIPWYDIVFMVLSVVSSVYFCMKEQELLLMGWEMGAPTVPFIFSTILWLLMIEASRRSGGPIFACIVLFFSTYPLFGSYMPGFMETRNYSLNHVASYHVLSVESMMGLIMHLFGELILGFMVFASAMQILGAGDFFNDLAMAIVGKTRGGTAKVAIISSGAFGSVSGAVVPNVMTTGAFTIPAMKREGLSTDFAGAVEATASAGGTLMPPIMGTVAFIMAEFLNVPYYDICVMAAIPAVLYFFCLFVQVDFYAAKSGLKPVLKIVDVPSVWRTLYRNVHILSGFAVLILILFFLRLTSQSPWIGTGVMVVLAMVRKESRLNLRGFITLIEATGRTLGDLIGILGPIGLILGSLILTGLAHSLPHEIISLSGGHAIPLLLLGAFAALVLGMGVTVSAVYIFLAIALAPSLVKAGFDLLASHLFVLYTGMLSSITPPVALAAFAATSISGGSPMKTGVEAMKLGIAKYILPFIFITSPALILRAPLSEILLIIPSVIIALLIIGGALEGYFWKLGRLTMVSRVLLFGAGLLMVWPTITERIYGAVLFVIVFVLATVLRGRSSLSGVLLKPAHSAKDTSKKE